MQINQDIYEWLNSTQLISIQARKLGDKYQFSRQNSTSFENGIIIGKIVKYVAKLIEVNSSDKDFQLPNLDLL